MKYTGFDFAGWATKYNTKCTDGRVIKEKAFAHQDGAKVALVYNHVHDKINEILGYAFLESRPEGMYAYGYCNDTTSGQYAKAAVEHGDIDAFSIYANKLQQVGDDVYRGNIKELSLVLSGANPGATIENVALKHSDGTATVLDEAIICSGIMFDEFCHSDEEYDEYIEHSSRSKYGSKTKSSIKNDEGTSDNYWVNVLSKYANNGYLTITPQSAFTNGADKSEIQKSRMRVSISDAIDMINKDKPFAVWYNGKAHNINQLIQHADSDEGTRGSDSKNSGETVADVLNDLTDDQKEVIGKLLAKAAGENPDITDEDRNTIESLSDIQKKVVTYLCSEVAAADQDDENDENDEDKENEEMKHNSFADYNETDVRVLSHSDVEDIIERAKSSKTTSFKDFFNNAIEEGGFTHADDDNSSVEYATDVQNYGVNDPSYLFPDAKLLDSPPRFIQRDQNWVSIIMNGTKHSPFNRIKSMFADITEDDARARGYIKGSQKMAEVIKLLKRVTTPQTVYKLQKFDRDDLIDITDFNIKNWILPEMRIMLNEEIARAMLVGDGREDVSQYKIQEYNIRPVWKDDPLFTIRAKVTKGSDDTATAKNIRRAMLKAKKNYKGTGSLTFFTTEDWKTEMLLIEDGIGHPLYKTEAELATALGVSRIVTVPVMENQSYNGNDLIGIALNLGDYTFGSTAGGSITTFEDFDIDFNKFTWLLETRLCGALTVPYSAIVLEVASSNSNTEEDSEG